MVGSVYGEDRNGSYFPLFIEDWVHGILNIPPRSLILEANWLARANNLRHTLPSIGGYLWGYEGV